MPRQYNKMFMQPSQTVTTRDHTSKLRVQEATGIKRNFFASRVTKDWNSLSEKTVSSKNIDIFKSLISKTRAKK